MNLNYECLVGIRNCLAQQLCDLERDKYLFSEREYNRLHKSYSDKLQLATMSAEVCYYANRAY